MPTFCDVAAVWPCGNGRDCSVGMPLRPAKGPYGRAQLSSDQRGDGSSYVARASTKPYRHTRHIGCRER